MDSSGPTRSRLMVLAVVGAALVAVLLWPSGGVVERQPSEEVLGPQVTVAVEQPDQRTTRAPAQQTGPQTFRISTKAEWDTAVAAARPGDTLRLVRTINQALVFQGDTDGVERPGSSGQPGNPITITADPGVWIDPGNQRSNKGALDIKQVDHVHVIGVNIRNSQFGLRLLQVRGTAQHPVVVANNTVTRTGHNGIKIGAQFQTVATSWSSHILIENNTVSRTGQTVARFGEGIYLGKGGSSYAWDDESHDIVVRGNEIFEVTAEAIDVKPGTRNIVVENNLLHDLAPIDGGVISAHYSNYDNPKPNEVDSLVIRGNRIWNVNLEGVSGSNDWAIWVGQGGVTLEDNLIWGMRTTSKTRAVRIKSPVQFGPHPIIIRNNVFWTASGAIAEGSPSGETLVSAEGNLGPGPGLGSVSVEREDFVGPVPAEGSPGPADAGSGPGSGFALLSAQSMNPDAGGGNEGSTTSTTTTVSTSRSAPPTQAPGSTTVPSSEPTADVGTPSTSASPAPPSTTAQNASTPTSTSTPPQSQGGSSTTSTSTTAAVVETDRGAAGAATVTVSTTMPARGASLEPAAEAGQADSRTATPGQQVQAEPRAADDSIPDETDLSPADQGLPLAESGGLATELSSDFGDPPEQLALAIVADGSGSGSGSTSRLELASAALAVVATIGAVLVRKRQATFG